MSNGRSGFDKLFLDTNFVILIIFSICCGWIALIIGILGLVLCKDPEAKQRAMIVTVISGVIAAINLIAVFTGALGNVLGQ